MGLTAESFLNLGTLDGLAAGDSPIHRLDPRAKVLVTGLYILAVASFGRYEVAAMAPFALYPAVLMALGGIPAGYLLRRVLAALPFVLLLAALNPVLDRTPMGPLGLTGGWVSLASILLRFLLTVSAVLALVATTSFDGVCLGMERLGLPGLQTSHDLALERTQRHKGGREIVTDGFQAGGGRPMPVFQQTTIVDIAFQQHQPGICDLLSHLHWHFTEHFPARPKRVRIEDQPPVRQTRIQACAQGLQFRISNRLQECNDVAGIFRHGIRDKERLAFKLQVDFLHPAQFQQEVRQGQIEEQVAAYIVADKVKACQTACQPLPDLVGMVDQDQSSFGDGFQSSAGFFLYGEVAQVRAVAPQAGV